jgi:hypothetical protein
MATARRRDGGLVRYLLLIVLRPAFFAASLSSMAMCDLCRSRSAFRAFIT